MEEEQKAGGEARAAVPVAELAAAWAGEPVAAPAAFKSGDAAATALSPGKIRGQDARPRSNRRKRQINLSDRKEVHHAWI